MADPKNVPASPGPGVETQQVPQTVPVPSPVDVPATETQQDIKEAVEAKEPHPGYEYEMNPSLVVPPVAVPNPSTIHGTDQENRPLHEPRKKGTGLPPRTPAGVVPSTPEEKK